MPPSRGAIRKFRAPARFRPSLFAAFLLAAAAWAPALASGETPPFISPYNTPESLDAFLVFSAPPRADVPDGQIHWVDQEVPGIDLLGPDGNLRNMCPGEGLAWSLAGGDPFGGGTFVAVECQGAAQDWQMLAFHLCKVEISNSIDNAHILYTRVPEGAVVGQECGHTHLSLGYWADPGARKDLPCPQWYVQGRYWLNPACLLQAPDLTRMSSLRLAGGEDWELRYLTPRLLNPARQLAAAAVIAGLALYLWRGFTHPAPPVLNKNKRPSAPAAEAVLKSGIWLGLLIMLVIVSTGPLWPIDGPRAAAYAAEAQRYQAMAEAAGYGDWQLLQAFYAAAVPRDDSGRPARPGQPGKVFPPEAAAAIPFGETDATMWGRVDPTQPGPYGRYLAWQAVAERWPPSWYERNVLGLDVSRQAQRQRDGLAAIAASPDMRRLGEQLGKTIRAEDLYSSSAGALGRTQILPEHFAPGGVCGDAPAMDMWNDSLAVAECTTRYLTVSGCWGRWWDNGEVWSALCGYNPGAWNSPADQWYWDLLRDRMARLAAAESIVLVQALAPGAPAPPERHVPTPVLGLLTAQAVLDGGQSAGRLPEPLAGWVAQAAPQMAEWRDPVRIVYRIFRAWTLIYYSPDRLLELGVQL